MRHILDDLHEPYADLLRAALDAATPGGARLALDVGCGPGLKAGWLAGHLAPGGRVVGLDIERGAVAAAAARQPGVWLVGDARDMPIAAGCAELAWCVCALDLFGDQQKALREIRRVLRPGGGLVVASATQRWARLRAWPEAVFAAWGERAAPGPADGLGDELVAGLAAAGFGRIALRAAMIDRPGANLARAALPLAGWEMLAPALAARLAAHELAACARAEELAEPEPLGVLLVVAGQAL